MNASTAGLKLAGRGATSSSQLSSDVLKWPGRHLDAVARFEIRGTALHFSPETETRALGLNGMGFRTIQAFSKDFGMP